MPNRSATFKQVDVTRALKGADAAGLAVGGFKIDPRTGEIVVWCAGAGAGAGGDNAAADIDKALGLR